MCEEKKWSIWEEDKGGFKDLWMTLLSRSWVYTQVLVQVGIAEYVCICTEKNDEGIRKRKNERDGEDFIHEREGAIEGKDPYTMRAPWNKRACRLYLVSVVGSKIGSSDNVEKSEKGTE